ncbi:MAG TPA: hypothetical protein VFB38_15390 [Chthonomonadaceae bacterium]|nr:hypothetical protein [Chthonomonadaceae bacterium]
MSYRSLLDKNGEWEVRLYLAGQRVPPGLYQQLGSGREVYLLDEDVLPASLDGRVACYRRIEHSWGQREHQGRER